MPSFSDGFLKSRGISSAYLFLQDIGTEAIFMIFMMMIAVLNFLVRISCFHCGISLMQHPVSKFPVLFFPLSVCCVASKVPSKKRYSVLCPSLFSWISSFGRCRYSHYFTTDLNRSYLFDFWSSTAVFGCLTMVFRSFIKLSATFTRFP